MTDVHGVPKYDVTLQTGNARTEKADRATGAPSSPSLILLHPPMAELGRRQELERKLLIVGRDEWADFVVPRSSVSRRHAELRHTPTGKWTLTDLGSTNGTFVNGAAAEDMTLENGDQIRFGDTIYKFVAGESVRYYDRVYEITVLDGLTAVHNERHFSAKLEREALRIQRGESDAALVVFDIDFFANINDEHGKLCGDTVLRELAGRLRRHTSSEAVVGRVGGEEFAVFLPGVELDEALEFAEEVREAVECEPFSFEGEHFEVTVSAGVAASALGELDAEGLWSEANKQLLYAKESGRNRIAP